jgi:hypothetical protein
VLWSATTVCSRGKLFTGQSEREEEVTHPLVAFAHPFAYEAFFTDMGTLFSLLD